MEEITQWSRVARVVYHVEQRYRYTYTQPVRELNHRLRVVPRHIHGDQRLLAHEVAVSGATGQPAVVWGRDDLGNPVCTVQADRVPEAVTFDASYQVQRFARSANSHPAVETDEAIDLDSFLRPTPLTAPDAALLRAAEAIRASSPWQEGRAYRAFHWAAASIVYRTGVTSVETTASDALAGGAGVCQDFAHVLIRLCRAVGLPARYVSGYVLAAGGTTEDPPAGASHAWAEVYSPTHGWRGFDPANNPLASEQHVKMAIGPDYGDVPPTRGTFRGTAESRIVVEVTVRQVEERRSHEPPLRVR